MHMYFKATNEIFAVGPYGQNHATAATLAFQRSLLETTQYDENAAIAEEHVFLKNNRDSVITEAALNEYMELFINFKLKVQAAEALGMDTIDTFQL